MREQWWLHCTSQWGWWTPLSEHVYWVAVTCKMTDQIEKWTCMKSCNKFEHSSVEIIQMIQKAEAMGNWWLAASLGQCTCSCIMHHSSCRASGKASNHPGDSAPRESRFGALWLPAFPKTTITFEREEISDCRWDSRKYDRAADGDWENCVRSQGV